MQTISELKNIFSGVGIVLQICVRPERLEDVVMLESVDALSGYGLHGDRYKTENGSRQVTLIQTEHLAATSSYLRRAVKLNDVRRNILTEGINLIALKGRRFQIGETILEYSGECHPCSRMEMNLGLGGYNAMRGHGGITAKVIRGGKIKVGDSISCIID